jgi:FkbM family methyltransferase
MAMLESIKQKIIDLVNRGYFGESLELLDKLEKSIPADDEIYSIKSTLYFHTNDFIRAEESAILGLLINPHNFDLLYNLSTIYFQSRNVQKAMFIIPKAMDCCKDATILNELALNLELVERSNQLSDEEYTDSEASFLFNLMQNVYKNLSNDYKFNVDFEFADLLGQNVLDQPFDIQSNRIELCRYLERFKDLYNRLHNEASKENLLQIICFRILGNKKIKLPLNNLNYWNDRKRVKKCIASDMQLKIDFMNWRLDHFDLERMGFSVQLFYTSPGIHATFGLKQYEYQDATGNLTIKAEQDDVVIDCGGLWGDTALYFAHEVGDLGHVYSFEFITSNINIFSENLKLNPKLKDRISIINKPVWDESGKEVYFTDNGPGSIVSMNQLSNCSGQVLSLSIDDLVRENQLPRVDLIKMDIEGAEIQALKGARETIKRFRPKLAISIYHQMSDFQNIPVLLEELCQDYIFTLDHYSIFHHETIIYALPKEKLK